MYMYIVGITLLTISLVVKILRSREIVSKSLKF